MHYVIVIKVLILLKVLFVFKEMFQNNYFIS